MGELPKPAPFPAGEDRSPSPSPSRPSTEPFGRAGGLAAGSEPVSPVRRLSECPWIIDRTPLCAPQDPRPGAARDGRETLSNASQNTSGVFPGS